MPAGNGSETRLEEVLETACKTQRREFKVAYAPTARAWQDITLQSVPAQIPTLKGSSTDETKLTAFIKAHVGPRDTMFVYHCHITPSDADLLAEMRKVPGNHPPEIVRMVTKDYWFQNYTPSAIDPRGMVLDADIFYRLRPQGNIASRIVATSTPTMRPMMFQFGLSEELKRGLLASHQKGYYSTPEAQHILGKLNAAGQEVFRTAPHRFFADTLAWSYGRARLAFAADTMDDPGTYRDQLRTFVPVAARMGIVLTYPEGK
jgi:hypothetical protein